MKQIENSKYTILTISKVIGKILNIIIKFKNIKQKYK